MVRLGGCAVLVAAGTLALPAAAHAAASTPLPDPSGVTLFALGLAGLLIGRRIAAKRPRD